MIRHLFILFLFVNLSACDPGYGYYLKNNRQENIYLKTTPELESLYHFSKDSIKVVDRFKIEQKGSVSIYKIEPQDTLYLYGHIGFEPTLKDVPFNYLEIICGTDSLVMRNKEEIFQAFKKFSVKKQKNAYYISF